MTLNLKQEEQTLNELIQAERNSEKLNQLHSQIPRQLTLSIIKQQYMHTGNSNALHSRTLWCKLIQVEWAKYYMLLRAQTSTNWEAGQRL